MHVALSEMNMPVLALVHSPLCISYKESGPIPKLNDSNKFEMRNLVASDVRTVRPYCRCIKVHRNGQSEYSG